MSPMHGERGCRSCVQRHLDAAAAPLHLFIVRPACLRVHPSNLTVLQINNTCLGMLALATTSLPSPQCETTRMVPLLRSAHRAVVPVYLSTGHY